jgi:ribosome production factor 2
MVATKSKPADDGTLSRKPKNRKAKKAMQIREPKLVENPKYALMIRGQSTSGVINDLLTDLCMIKKPFSKSFSRKNDIRPFEDASSLEFFAQKNDASLFAFGSHNKKRPHNLVLGRTFDYQILDMCEFGVTEFKSMKDFKGKKTGLSSRPLVVFDGDGFEHNEQLVQVKSLLFDFFRGQVQEKINLAGIEHVVVVTAVDDKIMVRTYSIGLKKAKSGDKRLPVVHLQLMGPCWNMAVRRTQFAPEDLSKSALRRPKRSHIKPKSVKNVRPDGMGDQIGRLHIDKQDLGKMANRRFKAFKGKKEAVRD